MIRSVYVSNWFERSSRVVQETSLHETPTVHALLDQIGAPYTATVRVNGEMLAPDALETPVWGDDSITVLAVVAGG